MGTTISLDSSSRSLRPIAAHIIRMKVPVGARRVRIPMRRLPRLAGRHPRSLEFFRKPANKPLSHRLFLSWVAGRNHTPAKVRNRTSFPAAPSPSTIILTAVRGSCSRARLKQQTNLSRENGGCEIAVADRSLESMTLKPRAAAVCRNSWRIVGRSRTEGRPRRARGSGREATILPERLLVAGEVKMVSVGSFSICGGGERRYVGLFRGGLLLRSEDRSGVVFLGLERVLRGHSHIKGPVFVLLQFGVLHF